MRRITHDEFQAQLKAQGVSWRLHYALVCPSCKTVQSMALLIKHGVTPDDAETLTGFSCVGRFTKPAKLVGCDWTLGGLFQIHELEVTHAGQAHRFFEIATPEQAQALERSLS